MKGRGSESYQKPIISVGSQLSIGKVVKICYNGVDIENSGNRFFVSRTAVEKVYEDDLENNAKYNSS